MKVFRVVGLLILVFTVSTWPAVAQEGNWGVGVFANYNVPVFGLGDWYENDSKFGLNAAYVLASNVTVEMEFHHGNFNDGSLLTRTFTWTDGNDYTSPNAASNMSLNSLLVNALVRLRQIGQPFAASSFASYIAVGGGFYRYKNDVSGLLWPGQTGDLVIEMDPFTDQRFALGINAGLGVEAFIIDNVAVDLRARYNMMIGDLRGLEDWELSETFPLQMLDLGAGVKFYFSGK
jgi:opacity protein-like surface antigen